MIITIPTQTSLNVFVKFISAWWNFYCVLTRKSRERDNALKVKINMLTLRITYGWLNTTVPQIFGDGWESWFDNLSEYEILNLKMNRSGLVHYRRFINGRLFKKRYGSIKFTSLCLVWNRLTTLLQRLEGELPENYTASKNYMQINILAM